MDFIYNLPDRFFGLFQSQNRYIYIESLMLIQEEYLYNDYFLTKDTCIQIVADHFSNRMVDVSADVIEGEEIQTDELESTASKILNRLLYFGWLKKVEDYSNFKTNIVIPEYASMFIQVFYQLEHPEENETDLFIQNVYTNIYSFYYDKKAGIEILKAAKMNISHLNRALQNILHNMDQFFTGLLTKENYEELLVEHLEVFVEDTIHKKYNMLKTSDNFYIYKNDIQILLKRIYEDETRLAFLKEKLLEEGKSEEEAMGEVWEVLEGIDRGIQNMERRIAHIDSEYSKYVQATVNRLEYLLNKEQNTKGAVIELLNLIGGKKREQILKEVSNQIVFHDLTVLTQDSFYKKKRKTAFEKTVALDEPLEPELTREEVLRMNRVASRYSRERIEQFVSSHMENGVFETKDYAVTNDEEFELLILSYDYGIRKHSPYTVDLKDCGEKETNGYHFPILTFRKK